MPSEQPTFKLGWGRSPQATRRGESIAVALRSKRGSFVQSRYFQTKSQAIL